MSKEKAFDVIVIGAGPGGYVCAIRCAQLGLKTALVEKNQRLGGTCLNVGCIPSKALLHSTEVFHELKEHASAHGIVCKEIEHDLSALMKKKDGVVDQLGKGVRALVTKKGVTCLEGTARIIGSGDIEIDSGKSAGKYKANEIVIATGSKPVELPFLPYDGRVVVNSDHGIAFDSVPKKWQ